MIPRGVVDSIVSLGPGGHGFDPHDDEWKFRNCTNLVKVYNISLTKLCKKNVRLVTNTSLAALHCMEAVII